MLKLIFVAKVPNSQNCHCTILPKSWFAIMPFCQSTESPKAQLPKSPLQPNQKLYSTLLYFSLAADYSSFFLSLMISSFPLLQSLLSTRQSDVGADASNRMNCKGGKPGEKWQDAEFLFLCDDLDLGCCVEDGELKIRLVFVFQDDTKAIVIMKQESLRAL